jgi:xanthine dehydrogenase/oxidase
LDLAGSLPAIFIIESIMEHVAKSLNKSPEEVRMINLYQKGQLTPLKHPLLYCNISGLWSQLIESSDFETRQDEVNAFNTANRWKKKGLSVVPLKFGIKWSQNAFDCLLSVYAGDGSVMVTTGGIEMGQGLVTKVVQVVASTLSIDIELIQSQPSNILTAPNNQVTGGSTGSELSCAAALSACQKLLEQMQPARKKLPSNATWFQIVSECSRMGIDLQAKGR